MMSFKFYFIFQNQRHYLGCLHETEYYYCWQCQHLLCQIIEDGECIELCPKCKRRATDEDADIERCYIFMWYKAKYKNNFGYLKKGIIMDEKGKTYFLEQFQFYLQLCPIHVLHNHSITPSL